MHDVSQMAGEGPLTSVARGTAEWLVEIHQWLRWAEARLANLASWQLQFAQATREGNAAVARIQQLKPQITAMLGDVEATLSRDVVRIEDIRRVEALGVDETLDARVQELVSLVENEAGRQHASRTAEEQRLAQERAEEHAREQARISADAEARRRAEAAARQAAEQEMRRQAEYAARLAQEEIARQAAAVEARRRHDEEIRREAALWQRAQRQREQQTKLVLGVGGGFAALVFLMWAGSNACSSKSTSTSQPATTPDFGSGISPTPRADPTSPGYNVGQGLGGGLGATPTAGPSPSPRPVVCAPGLVRVDVPERPNGGCVAPCDDGGWCPPGRQCKPATLMNDDGSLGAPITACFKMPPPNVETPDQGDDGTDPARPTLAPDDDGFVDTRGGWGWGDRCWNNIKAGKLGWAKAECRRGMSIADPSAQQPRASLLYNLGLIEKKSGNFDDARRFFEQSLALREHPEVRAALDSLP